LGASARLIPTSRAGRAEPVGLGIERDEALRGRIGDPAVERGEIGHAFIGVMIARRIGRQLGIVDAGAGCGASATVPSRISSDLKP
jgi:hypothetical protein